MDKRRISLGRFSLPLDALRQGGWLLVATIVAGFFNYVSNVFVGRMLGPVDYGIFTALVAFSLILTVMTGMMQTVITNYVTRLHAGGAMAEVGAFLVHMFKRLLPWGLGATLVLSMVSGPLATFLQLPSPLPIIALSFLLIPMSVMPVVMGGLRGLQRFGALGGMQISLTVFRLAAVVGLIAMGLGATGAVAALPLSSLVTFTLGMILLADLLRRRETRATPRLDGLIAYSLNTLLALVGFAVLTNGDVILVKSHFSPTEAGLYSAIAVLGKTVLWLSMPVVILLLPKATELQVRGQSAVSLLRKSLLIVGLLCGGVTTVFFVIPSFIVGTFFGEQFLANTSLLGLYGLAMTLYSLINVWLFYYLAMQDHCYGYMLMLGAVLLIACFALFGSNLTQVVVILVGIGIVLYLAGELLLLVRERKPS